jgi:MFS family permease
MINATRRYALITFLTWLPTGLYVAPMVLLMLDRGLSVPTIAAVGLAYSLTCATLELPTGGLADVLGRRAVLLGASLASLAGLVLLGLATTAAVFAIAAFLRGAARALGSGPAEAWYVDTMHANGDTDIGPGIARGSVSGSLGLAIGTITGGLIPLALTGLVAVPLAVPVLLGAVVELVRLVVVMVAMPEPRHQRPGLRKILLGVPLTVREGLRLGLRDGVLARILFVTGCVGIALASIELLTPAWLAKITGRLETASIAYAIVAALGFAASAAGAALSARVVRIAGTPARGGIVGLSIMASALLMLAGSATLTGNRTVVAAAVAYCLIFVGLGIANPAAATLTHDRVESAQRATVLSVQSLAAQLVGAVGVNALARLSDRAGLALTFSVVALLIGGSGLTLRGVTLTKREPLAVAG